MQCGCGMHWLYIHMGGTVRYRMNQSSILARVVCVCALCDFGVNAKMMRKIV